MASNMVLRTPAAPLTLDILKGVHSGVSLPLERDAYLVGSGADCDLMLSDREVSAHHMRLQFAGSNVMIEAVGADVLVDDTTVPVGHGLQVPTPVTVTLGEASLSLSRPTLAAKAKESSRTTWMLSGVAVFSLLTIAAVQAGVGDGDHQLSMATVADKTMTTGTVTPSVLSPQDVSAALAAKLSKTGLSDLKVEVDGTFFSVSGAVSDEARNSWAEVQAWFDRSYGANYVLTSQVGEAKARTAPKFKLQAIWFGETPYAIAADGSRLYKGAALEDGWHIKEIRDGSLTAARPGEEFVLRF
ncbi:hypothetical protein MYG64_36405 (plasmid) [Ensifer adhaerens]|uniref:SctD/MshK family protein n=1 Tax=Ensifer adhaerens TaxID=106592 RepID=UPI0021019B28|nr:FHA domain-containing protein [Ensifer adhaerens]UTV41877.1 hypothetical protein MYG64_36405 [Ensifer adhaerens]